MLEYPEEFLKKKKPILLQNFTMLLKARKILCIYSTSNPRTVIKKKNTWHFFLLTLRSKVV